MLPATSGVHRHAFDSLGSKRSSVLQATNSEGVRSLQTSSASDQTGPHARRRNRFEPQPSTSRRAPVHQDKRRQFFARRRVRFSEARIPLEHVVRRLGSRCGCKRSTNSGNGKSCAQRRRGRIATRARCSTRRFLRKVYRERNRLRNSRRHRQIPRWPRPLSVNQPGTVLVGVPMEDHLE